MVGGALDGLREMLSGTELGLKTKYGLNMRGLAQTSGEWGAVGTRSPEPGEARNARDGGCQVRASPLLPFPHLLVWPENTAGSGRRPQITIPPFLGCSGAWLAYMGLSFSVFPHLL